MRRQLARKNRIKLYWLKNMKQNDKQVSETCESIKYSLGVIFVV